MGNISADRWELLSGVWKRIGNIVIVLNSIHKTFGKILCFCLHLFFFLFLFVMWSHTQGWRQSIFLYVIKLCLCVCLCLCVTIVCNVYVDSNFYSLLWHKWADYWWNCFAELSRCWLVFYFQYINDILHSFDAVLGIVAYVETTVITADGHTHKYDTANVYFRLSNNTFGVAAANNVAIDDQSVLHVEKYDVVSFDQIQSIFNDITSTDWKSNCSGYFLGISLNVQPP